MISMNITHLLGYLKGFEPRAFFAILAASALVIVGVDFVVLTRPQIHAMTVVHAKTVKFNEDINTLNANMQRMDKFRANLDDARSQVQGFEKMIHKEDDVPALLKAISATSNIYNIKVDQLSPQKSDGVVLVKNGDGNYRSLSILVNARAGYHDLGRFLNRLEQDGVFWQLESISVVADKADPIRHQIKIGMKILILGN